MLLSMWGSPRLICHLPRGSGQPSCSPWILVFPICKSSCGWCAGGERWVGSPAEVQYVLCSEHNPPGLDLSCRETPGADEIREAIFSFPGRFAPCSISQANLTARHSFTCRLWALHAPGHPLSAQGSPQTDVGIQVERGKNRADGTAPISSGTGGSGLSQWHTPHWPWRGGHRQGPHLPPRHSQKATERAHLGKTALEQGSGSSERVCWETFTGSELQSSGKHSVKSLRGLEVLPSEQLRLSFCHSEPVSS